MIAGIQTPLSFKKFAVDFSSRKIYVPSCKYVNKENRMGELVALPNIGKDTEKQLNRVGITTIEQLRETGSKKAWLMIRGIDETACLHRLYGLEGAVLGVKKSALSPETKRDLKEFFSSFS